MEFMAMRAKEGDITTAVLVGFKLKPLNYEADTTEAPIPWGDIKKTVYMYRTK